ncbi:MAG TPA: ROK family protein [Pyrinomonadaceae bacterium]|nr:ROK family protein [Pyrinomonadaceae bacterium]
MNNSFIAGIDIGGTKTSVAIARPHEAITARETFPTPTELNAKGVVKKAVTILKLLAKQNGGKLTAIGLGCAGPMDFEKGAFLLPPNLPPSWHYFPIRSVVEKESGVPVVVENDANAAAIGEHLFGTGRGHTDLVYLTISTGIGGGIIADNKLAHRLSEPGHITVMPDGDLCGCGARGCFEAMCSGTAIARRARKYMKDGTRTRMSRMVSNLDDVTARTVVAALREQDDLAKVVWRETIRFMAIGINSIMAMLAPQAVILGGGVATGAGKLLLEPLRQETKARLQILKPSPILLAGLEADSVLYGALALASREHFVNSLAPEEVERQK